MNSRRNPLDAAAVSRLTRDPGPWLSCDACFHLVDQYVEAALSGSVAHLPAMRAHLSGCSACAEEAVSLLLLAAAEQGVDPAPALQELTGRAGAR